MCQPYSAIDGYVSLMPGPPRWPLSRTGGAPMRELFGYALALAAIALVLLIAAEQGGIIGTDISDWMIRFINKDF